MTEEDQMAAKQQYLRDNIVDLGYNAEEFANMLNEKKPGVGMNVNLYTMNELYQYVAEFQNRVHNQYQD